MQIHLEGGFISFLLLCLQTQRRVRALQRLAAQAGNWAAALQQQRVLFACPEQKSRSSSCLEPRGSKASCFPRARVEVVYGAVLPVSGRLSVPRCAFSRGFPVLSAFLAFTVSPYNASAAARQKVYRRS